MLSMTSFTPVQGEGSPTDSFWDSSGDDVLLISGWHLASEEVMLGSICESVEEIEEVSVGMTVVLSRCQQLMKSGFH